MKRIVIVMLLAALFLIGCSRETQVWLPEEEVVELQGKDIVRIPMGEETAPAETELTQPSAEESESVANQPTETEKVSSSKQTTTTSKKNTSKDTTTNKETVSATGKPSSSKPSATEAPATEPVVTEPSVTEAPATEPVVTESIVTEPPATEPPLYDIGHYQPGNLEYEMLERINEYRAEEALDALWMDTWLCAIASCRSYEASLVWSHTRPDGRHFATVLTDYGYSARAVQELMVYDSGSGDAVAIVDRWMASNAHRELLLADYTTAGIGVYRANGLIYVTCLLAK